MKRRASAHHPPPTGALAGLAHLRVAIQSQISHDSQLGHKEDITLTTVSKSLTKRSPRAIYNTINTNTTTADKTLHSSGFNSAANSVHVGQDAAPDCAPITNTDTLVHTDHNSYVSLFEVDEGLSRSSSRDLQDPSGGL